MEKTEEMSKLDLLRKTIFEGYYDETHDYCVTFIKSELENTLKEILNAQDVKII